MVIRRIKDHDLLNSKRASGCTFWRVVRIDRTVQRFAVNAVERDRGQYSRDNGSSATPHSSARKGDKSPAPSNRSSLRSISRYPSDRCKSPPKVVEPGVNGDLGVHPKIESPRGNARAHASACQGRDAPFSRTDAGR